MQANRLLPLLHQPVEGWEGMVEITVVWKSARDRPLRLKEASVVKGEDGEEEEEAASERSGTKGSRRHSMAN